MSKSRGPRVLYVIDSLSRSGAEQSLASMAPHLLACGVGLEVAYLVEREGLLDDIKAAGVRTHAVTRPTSRVPRIRALRDLVHERQPHLVHTTLFESDVAGRVAAWLAGVPSVSSLVNVAYGPDQRRDVAINPFKLAAARSADRLTAKLSVRFHAITEHVAQRMSRELRISRELIDVIPRGRDRASLGQPSFARRAAVRESLGLADDDVVMLAASRHEYQKGLDVLVNAMPKIVAAKPNTTLLIAGRAGNQTKQLNTQVDDLGLENRVRILGMRTDVPDLMTGSDVFILPSRWEGFGGVLLEAMALGVPIVTADLAPLREVAAGAAQYFSPENPRALTESVLSVLDNRECTKRRVAIAATLFEERFAVERVASAMARFYDLALRNKTLKQARS